LERLKKIVSAQEHPGAMYPWEVLTERYGIVVKQVHLPIPLNDPADTSLQ
jgi:selenocysteine lyase/cysteine desulfurase